MVNESIVDISHTKNTHTHIQTVHSSQLVNEVGVDISHTYIHTYTHIHTRRSSQLVNEVGVDISRTYIHTHTHTHTHIQGVHHSGERSGRRHQSRGR